MFSDKLTRANAPQERIARDFAEALADDFAAYGAKAIADLRQSKLDAYLRLVAAVEPPQNLRRSITDGMSDDDVIATVAALDRWLAAHPETEKETPSDNHDMEVAGGDDALQSDA